MDKSDRISAFEILQKGFESTSAEETMCFASEFAKELSDNAFLALHGNLGTGKTTFVKGLAKGLGVTQTVKSPSFSVYSLYGTNRGTLVHLDAYRLSGAEDFDNLLLDEIVSGNKIVCVEWAEVVAESIPSDALHLYFSADLNSHKIRLG